MAKPIKSKDYTDEPMTLVDEATFAPICEGELRPTSRGEQHHVTGGRAPHTPNSSGKVWCYPEGGDIAHTFEFYPAVIGAKWMHDATLKAHKAVTRG